MFGNFVMATGVMMVTGILAEVSSALQVSIATAGQLISTSALCTCLGAPVFAAWVAGWDRQKLLTASLLWYGLLHALAASTDQFSTLLGWRAMAMAGAAIFTPQAASCVGLLVPAAQRGRAITFIFLGWSVASVLGTPLGAWLGGTFGWRYPFAFISLLSLLSAIWLWRTLPKGIVPPALSRAAWVTTLGSRTLMLTVSVTMVSAAGQFILFSYLAPYLKNTMGASTTDLSLLLLLYGLFGFIGNAFVARHIDRLGPPAVSCCPWAAWCVAWPCGPWHTPPPGWLWRFCPGVWGCFPPIQPNKPGWCNWPLTWPRPPWPSILRRFTRVKPSVPSSAAGYSCTKD